jgi:hypothetical protein
MQSTEQLMAQLQQKRHLRRHLRQRAEAALQESLLVNAQLQQEIHDRQATQQDHQCLEREFLDIKQRLEAFFCETLDGFFFMMMAHIRRDKTVNQEAVLDYVFSHQHVTRVNSTIPAQYGAVEGQL